MKNKIQLYEIGEKKSCVNFCIGKKNIYVVLVLIIVYIIINSLISNLYSKDEQIRQLDSVVTSAYIKLIGMIFTIVWSLLVIFNTKKYITLDFISRFVGILFISSLLIFSTVRLGIPSTKQLYDIYTNNFNSTQGTIQRIDQSVIEKGGLVIYISGNGYELINDHIDIKGGDYVTIVFGELSKAIIDIKIIHP